ncbi:MAG TPA: phosphate signaling complex protein PhoU [Bacteroidota bacterium]|jgi:phosphate transport system protein|nr:phosphate signaling complex protein PhoU [Bacteroidota bacterium]
MQRHFEKELESLKTSLIKMGSIVEDAVGIAIKAMTGHDAETAQKIIDGDERVNILEMEIDNAIVDLLALQQPVASDLRLILAAQKINNDLERIGDHAVNIAESARSLARMTGNDPLLELPKMSEIAQSMLRNALDAFIHRDPSLGKSVLAEDNTIDDLNREMTQEVIQLMKKNRETIDGGLELIRVSRNLERIADLATNIAEEVIFITEARIVKHHAGE